MSSVTTPARSAAGPQMSSRNRQMIYGLTIVVLFAAMYGYTEWLNNVKHERQLGEATIGNIDTGSFMLKLALLGGARGVAANVLWTRAIDLQKLHEWDRLSNTVDMITKLQPHFLSIWTYQSWNLAYNVSVEWDDPADKYEWIKQGINFVKQGVERNRRSPDLRWDTAWYYYHKIGFADEAVILRKVFYDDTDEDFKLDPLLLEEERTKTVRNDNFQMAYGWFTLAVHEVDKGSTTLGGGTRSEDESLALSDIQYVDKPVQKKRPGDMGFRAMPAHAQTRYATALEKASTKGVEPQFGDYAAGEWRKALIEWRDKFGNYPFEAFSHKDQIVKLDWISQPETFAKLTDPQKYWTERWTNDANYRYWKSRSAAEATRQGVEARKLFYEATVAYKAADYPQAAEKYLQGLQLWKDLMDQFPDYRDDQLSRKDTVFLLRRYVLTLRQLGQGEPPESMPFYQLWKENGNEQIPVDPYDSLEILGRSSRPKPSTNP